VSTGCPASIGPEVSLAGARALRSPRIVLVGDEQTLRAAAELTRFPQKHLVPFDGTPPSAGRVAFVQAGPALRDADRSPERITKRAGAAQLAYVEGAYRLAVKLPRSVLVTAAVSKAAIARSGVPGAEKFLGHTEWLRDLDRSKHVVMCFASEKLVTSLVTTHVPFAEVPRELTAEGVAEATYWLAELLLALGKAEPRVAVASLNPHAGESELLGTEERTSIVPGMKLARRRLRGRAVVEGPVGAETAYRKAYAGGYDGVVAMYHDMATIPMKLVAFGDAVNVTMGLSIPRTSVDHGTAYDIAWRGLAKPDGMVAALRLAGRLAQRGR
jgi:4-hydroxythreonine-4-phosphate dehydrogenase